MYPDPLISVLLQDDMKKFLSGLLDSIPNIVTILNEERRVVYSNKALLDRFDIPSFKEAFGLRPGNVFRCKCANVTEEGCGTTENCKLCGAMNAIEDSRVLNKAVTNECRIVSREHIRISANEYRVTSIPFETSDNKFFLLFIEDISSRKRKVILERIFYHDAMNYLNNLNGIISLVEENPDVEQLHVDLLKNAYNSLHGIISEQKDLAAAENGVLTLNPSEIGARELLETLAIPFQNTQYLHVKIIIVPDSSREMIFTDVKLLSRILNNMLKNAVEASSGSDIIELGIKRKDGKFIFWVRNPAYIPRNVQLQIFERTFSTKGIDRGLGTYGMKILGENYLQGKVDFSSDRKTGTTFRITLPARMKI